MGNIGWYRSQTSPLNDLAEPLAHPGLFRCVAIMLRWSDLQSTQGAALDLTTYNTARAKVVSYNAANPSTPLGVVLSVSGGSVAPSWAKSLSGGPLTIQTNGPWTVGIWWSTSYRSAWSSLVSALATSLDSDTLVQEVRVTSCSTNTLDEPFNTPTANNTDLTTLYAAGYTDTLELACLQGAITDFSVWTHPTLDFTFNPYHTTADQVHEVLANQYTLTNMAIHVSSFQSQATRSNHGLTASIGSNLQPIYNEFLIPGGGIGMQLASPSDQTDASFTVAKQYGVTKMEIWDLTDTDGTATTPVATLQSWSKQLGGY